MVKLSLIAGMLSIYLLLMGCGGQVKKYDWLASESAHPDFPMKIVNGEFLYPNEDHGLHIPNMKLIHYGWGKSVSVHLSGEDLKPIPNKVRITYYSYVEDKFYQGNFNLPAEEISNHFEEGYELDSGEKVSFKRLVVGVAPGGRVSVWLQGIDKSVEVFFGAADTINYEWERFVDNPGITREEYRSSILQEILPTDKHVDFAEKRAPAEKFDHFRDHYPWAMRFFRMSAPSSSIGIEYLNGEKEEVFYRNEEEEIPEPKHNPAPRHLAFRSGGALFYIHFDEDEMLEVFEEMANGDDPLYFDIAPGLPQSETRIRLRDKDDNHTAIEKFTVEEID